MAPMLPREGRTPIDGCQILPLFSAVLKIDPRHGTAADPLSIVGVREEPKAMATAAIHVVPDDSFDDWLVRDENGGVFGHYGTREAAELVAQAIARKSGDELVIHLPDGRATRKMGGQVVREMIRHPVTP
jgi:hypothetical protein